jgi:hypothetical protein
MGSLDAGSANPTEAPQSGAPPDSAKLDAQSQNLENISDPAHWIELCTVKFKTGEVIWLNGMGANDVRFMPKSDFTEEIFDECMRIIPLDPDKAKIYKIWLNDRITEIKSLTNKTRKEAEAILTMNGGFLNSSAAIYSHSLCRYLKVRIQFESKGTTLNKDDKIKAVSKPYLGLEIED